MEFPLTQEFHVLVLLINHALERHEGLRVRCPAILETTPVIVGIFIHIVGVARVLLVESPGLLLLQQ